MPDLHLRLTDEDDETQAVSPGVPIDDDAALAMLGQSEITATKLIPWGSNYTFAVALEGTEGANAATQQLAIYKPRAGEAPLWDFPTGTLYQREHAAYVLSRLLGWRIVPPTIVRGGPHGIGSVQLYIEPMSEHSDDYDFWGRQAEEIERLVVFDMIANNADRKLTHCLVDHTGHVWGIDHGLTFNTEPKLRTVLWQFCDTEISPGLLADLRTLVTRRDVVMSSLCGSLAEDEIAVFFARLEALIALGKHPPLDPRRNVPYGWW